ncbi:MAG TPA: AAA family ATPase [Acidimicrobiales bacterium]|nr:AAA family ATPase [Acidimicrobiales bacterium]
MEPDSAIEPAGLTPPDQGPIEFTSREREEDRATRKPMILWDRIKILLLLLVVWWFFVLAAMGDNPILSFDAAFDEEVRNKWWLLALIGIEVIRQTHYLISERSAKYHARWTKRFAAFDERTGRLNDWTRYRIARVLKWVFLFLIVDLIVARITDTNPLLAVAQIPAQLFAALPIVFQLAFGFFFIMLQFVGLFWFLSKGGIDVYFPDDVKTRFTDVWGQDAVLARIKENIVFLEDPEMIEKHGGYVPGGLLLWGPPGTGKTLMAEAVAGETGKPYVFVDPGAFSAMFMGIGVLKVKSLFRKLRKLAVRYGGVIVFFDEADSLGSRGQAVAGFAPALKSAIDPASATCNGFSYFSSRVASLLFQASMQSSAPEPRPRRHGFVMGGMGGGGGDGGTLQALLAELSGLKKPRGFVNRVLRRALGMRPKPPPKYRILVMMATNMPQSLDQALLRPGRIDRIYKVGYPHKLGRIRTYEGYLSKVKHSLTAEDIDKLATITPYATGATIKDLVNEALIYALREGHDVITWADITKAKQQKALGPPEDNEYIKRERHAVAVHEACHAVAAYRVLRHKTIDMATIERRGDIGGFVAPIPLEDRFVEWRSEYEAEIITSLASLAGERLFFDQDNSAGVGGDLENSTELAVIMEGYVGMGSTVASHGVFRRTEVAGGRGGGKDKDKNRGGEIIDHSLGARVENNLQDLLRRASHLLEDNRDAVLAVAHSLEAHKTVSGDDIVAVIEGHAGPLVDGRPYADPDVRRAIAAYHAEAVVAHKGGLPLEVALPNLNGQGTAVVRKTDLPDDPTQPVEVTREELAGQWARPTGNPDGDGNGESPVG